MLKEDVLLFFMLFLKVYAILWLPFLLINKITLYITNTISFLFIFSFVNHFDMLRVLVKENIIVLRR